MFLSSVTLVLQEMLEAALLVSVMLMFSHLFHRLWPESFSVTHRWIYFSAAFGVIGSALLAYFTPAISTWFDYVGQEVVNAGMHLVSLGFIVVLTFVVTITRYMRTPRSRNKLVTFSMASIVSLSIAREGCEIVLYLQGVTMQSDNISTVLFGSLLGAGIGGSIGILLYYSLVSMRALLARRLGVVLLSLIAGNMAGQMALLLNQADWIPFTAVAWNSSALIPEGSIIGRLLYALVGYEATPSMAHVSSYLIGILLVLVSPLSRKLWSSDPGMVTVADGAVR